MDLTIINLKVALHEYEKALILDALKRADFNKAQASVLLTVNRTTLISKMKRVGLGQFILEPAKADRSAWRNLYSKVEGE